MTADTGAALADADGEAPTPFSWLPDHQMHVLASLGHIDDQMHTVAEMLQDYSRAGVFDLREVVTGQQLQVIVERVRPIPEAASRHAADIVNALRSLVEHVLYAEIEHRLGRPLTDEESRAVEMPIVGDVSQLSRWLNHKWRRGLAPLGEDGVLTARIRALQPFNWVGEDTAPLRLLADHTNATKHRKPATVATLVGKVVAEHHVPGLSVLAPTGEPSQVGDVIVTTPILPRTTVDVWPLIAIRRPAAGWKVLMVEPAYLEQWVRETAVPTLLGLGPGQDLPAATDVRTGYDDVRIAAASVTEAPAAIRNLERLTAEGVIRPGFRDLLHRYCTSPAEHTAVDGWVDELSDAEVIRRWDRWVQLREDQARFTDAASQLIRIAGRRTERSQHVEP